MLLVALALGLRLGYSSSTPMWQGPDEPRQLEPIDGVMRRFPQLLEERRYLALTEEAPAFQAEVIDSMDRMAYWRFVPIGRQGEPVSFTDIWGTDGFQLHRPPLYFVSAAGFLAAAGTEGAEAYLLVGRYWSILLGTLLVVVVFGAVRVAAGDGAALIAAALAACLPMAGFIGGVISNDNLVNLMAASLFLVAFRLARDGLKPGVLVMMAAVVLIGLFTKRGFLTVAAVAAPLAIIAASFSPSTAAWRRRAALILAATGGAAVLVVGAGVLVAPAAVPFDLALYLLNEPDQASRVLELTPGSPLASLLLRNFLVSLGQGFVGMFGWYVQPVASWIVVVYLAIAEVGLFGSVVWLARSPGWRRWCGVIAAAAAAVVVVAALWESAAYFDPQRVPQGRYLLTLMVPFGLMLGAGWTTLAGLISPRAVVGVVAVLLPLLAVLSVAALSGSLQPFFRV